MNKNLTTGDTLINKKPSKEYDDGYDRIFRKDKGKELEDKEKPPIKGASSTDTIVLPLGNKFIISSS